MENLCKNNKSLENIEVNSTFLQVSAQFLSQKGEKTPEKAINYLISQLNINDLCSQRLKVVELSSDYINGCVDFGGAPNLVKIAEALKEAAISTIAEEIAARQSGDSSHPSGEGRGEASLILIAGPSSSGKTTFCKKLTYALQQQGLKPKGISLDDFYGDKENCPLDENGEYDFEHLEALNLPLLRSCISRLLRGEVVQLPSYDFQSGKSILDGGEIMQLAPDELLILEGIHALNPELLGPLPSEGGNLSDSPGAESQAQPATSGSWGTFKIYISALATQHLPDGTYFPTTDNRLIRRMVRDIKFRGTSVQSTIDRWPSVRRGEERWITPFQKYADYNINSSFQYEICLLKQHALPLLQQVQPSEPQYAEAQRLIAIMEQYHDIPVDLLPPYSLLREFLGGSAYE